MGEDVGAEGVVLGERGGFSSFDFRVSIVDWGGEMLGLGFGVLVDGGRNGDRAARADGVGGLGSWVARGRFGEGPLEADAVEVAVGGDFLAVDFVDFGEECGEVGEAVGEGVLGGEGGEVGEFFDGGDFHFAQAGGVGDLAGAEEWTGPEADGLAFFAGLDEGDEVAFEEEHGGRVAWVGGRCNCQLPISDRRSIPGDRPLAKRSAIGNWKLAIERRGYAQCDHG